MRICMVISTFSFRYQVWCLEALELLDSIRGHENPVCTLVTKRNMLFSGSLKKIKVCRLNCTELRSSSTVDERQNFTWKCL